MQKIRIVVNDLMQQGYVYFRTEPMGGNYHVGFRPQLTPKEMLALGVFGGKYMTDCAAEFPADWFAHARSCAASATIPELNFFGVNASQPLSVWRAKGWMLPRRSARLVPVVLPLLHGPACPDDQRQIRRWRADASPRRPDCGRTACAAI